MLTTDGFLRTGDKGEQDADCNLRLTGRMKEIFKTSKGKYVAPAPIENRLAVHDRIEQVCVVGEGLSAPLGLCVLSEVVAGRPSTVPAGRWKAACGRTWNRSTVRSTSTSAWSAWSWCRKPGRWTTVSSRRP